MLSMRKNLLNARYSGKKIYNIVATWSNETKLRNFMKRFKIQKNFSNYYYVLSIGTKSLLPIFCLLLTSGYCIRTFKFACKTKGIKWIQILFFSCTINCFFKTLFVLLLKKLIFIEGLTLFCLVSSICFSNILFCFSYIDVFHKHNAQLKKVDLTQISCERI
jgi:hypothetical protein